MRSCWLEYGCTEEADVYVDKKYKISPESILAFVAQNQLVTLKSIERHFDISREHFYQLTLLMRCSGKLKAVEGVGIFVDEKSYSDWQERGKRIQLQNLRQFRKDRT